MFGIALRLDQRADAIDVASLVGQYDGAGLEARQQPVCGPQRAPDLLSGRAGS